MRILAPALPLVPLSEHTTSLSSLNFPCSKTTHINSFTRLRCSNKHLQLGVTRALNEDRAVQEYKGGGEEEEYDTVMETLEEQLDEVGPRRSKKSRKRKEALRAMNIEARTKLEEEEEEEVKNDNNEKSLQEKIVELYMGEKGILFWLNKFAYASIFIVIGAWVLFRFVGPSLGLYTLDNPPLDPNKAFIAED